MLAGGCGGGEVDDPAEAEHANQLPAVSSARGTSHERGDKSEEGGPQSRGQREADRDRAGDRMRVESDGDARSGQHPHSNGRRRHRAPSAERDPATARGSNEDEPAPVGSGDPALADPPDSPRSPSQGESGSEAGPLPQGDPAA